MKFLQSQKGSTLLLVVITIAVLTVLGTTVLSMSFMNYNMKFSDERMKKTLYYSESGIEQVYAILGKYIDDALLDASTKTETDLKTKEGLMVTMLTKLEEDTAALYADEIEQDKLYAIYEGAFTTPIVRMSNAEFMNSGLYLKALLLSEPKYTNYANTFLRLQAVGTSDEINVQDSLDPKRNLLTDHEIIIDTNEIVEYSKEQMDFYYQKYFDDHESDIESKILDVNTYVYLDENDDSASGNSSIKLSFNTSSSDGNITTFTESGTDEMVINGLTSTFNYKGRSRKAITTDIVIKSPGDSMPLDVAQNKIIVDNNPLWQYALVTHNDLIFSGTKSSITGSVYALGNNPTGTSLDLDPSSANSTRNSTNYKGIMLSGSNADVTIDGDVVSQSYVQIAKGSINNKLTMKDSHVYCNSLVIQDGSTGGQIFVNNGNVYTRDDIELNGSSSTINIDGSYYGFMSSAIEYNQTSSIVINADLATSSISITGKEATIDNPEPADKKGVIIAGVSYVNDIFDPDPYLLDGSKLYQSGESMGIKGNYIAYAFPTTETSGDAGLFNADDLATQTVGTSGLNLYYKFKTGSYMGIEDKVKYFKAISEDATFGSYLNTGGGSININESAYLYAAGAVIGTNSGVNSVVVKNLDSSTYITNYAESEIARDYVYIMNTLRHRPTGTYKSNFYNEGGQPNGSALEFIKKADDAVVIDNYSKMNEKDFDMTAGDISTGAVDGPGSASAKEVKIVESDPTDSEIDHNILLVGSGAYIGDADGTIKTIKVDGVDEDYYVIKADSTNPDEMQGIIITSGKVRMAGDLTFYGSIIAVDDIYLESDSINIVNNDLNVKKYLAELVLTDADLTEMFSEDTSTTVGIAMDKIEYIKDVSVGKGSIDSLRQNYDEFIFYQNWRIAE